MPRRKLLKPEQALSTAPRKLTPSTHGVGQPSPAPLAAPLLNGTRLGQTCPAVKRCGGKTLAISPNA